MFGELNFVGNTIDLGAIAVDKLTAWMDPHQSSFNYPGSRLLRFCGLVQDEEMFKLTTNLDHDDTMFMKGSASNLTIDPLNTI